MSLTVRQILEIPELAGMELIAGESGLDRDVGSVNVMEAPDIAQWLHGGELLLSTGYQFRDNLEEFEELVMKIHAAGAVALGFKNRFFQEFPARARDFANWLGFPILSLPRELPYSDIIRIVILKTDEVESIRFSESVLRSFSQILTEGGDIEKILHNLSFFLKCNVCFLDATSGYCFCASNEGFPEVRRGCDKNVLLEKYQYERLTLSNRTYGYFLFESSPQEGLWSVVLEHAKTAMLLAVQKDIATKQVEARYRNEFVQDLVTNNIRYHEEVLNRARRFGWDLVGKLRCVIFDIDGYKRYFEHPLPDERAAELEEAKERIYSICRQEMRFAFQDLPYLTMSDSIVFIVNMDKCTDFERKLKKCSEDVQVKIRNWTGFTVSIGLGDEKKDFFGLGESYEEARRAIEMMRPLSGGGSLYAWNELGVFTVLAGVARSSEARKFFASRLGKLTGANRSKHGELLHTLHVLAEQDWNFKAAARQLNIHYNTIHYRYEKICELLGMNLSTGEKRLEIAVALKLLYLNPQLHEE